MFTLNNTSMNIGLPTAHAQTLVHHPVYQYIDSTTRTFRTEARPGPAPGTTGDSGTWHMVVDTGTDDMFGHAQILGMNLPEYIAREAAQVLRKTYEEALLEATNEELEDDEWEEEFEDGVCMGTIDDVPGLPPAFQLSSRIQMVKDKAKEITIDGKWRRKAGEVVSTVVQGNIRHKQKGEMEVKSTVAMHQQEGASGRSKMTIAGPAPKGEGFEVTKPSIEARKFLPETPGHTVPQTEKTASTSSAAILREEVQRLAAANPSMVSTVQPNLPQEAQQPKMRDIGGTRSQSVLPKPAMQGAQTTAPKLRRAQSANRPPGPQFKPGSLSTSTAPAAANTPPGKQPNQSAARPPTAPPMWVFTGCSGGPPTPNPTPQTQRTQPPPPPAPAPTASDEGQMYGSTYTDDEFLHNYTTYRYGSMEAMSDYMERSLLHACRRMDCLQAPGNQLDGTFRFYRPPPLLTFQRPYGPGLAEGPFPPRRREEGRKVKKSYYD